MKRLWVLFAFFIALTTTASLAAPPKITADVSAAFNVSHLRAGDSAAIAIVVDIPQGLHSQSNTPLESSLIPLVATLQSGPVKVQRVAYPAPTIENYPQLGKVSVYTGKVIVYAFVEVPGDGAHGPVTIAGKVRYQLCDEQACFRPQTTDFSISTTIVPAGAPVTPANADLFAGLSAATTQASPPPTSQAAVDDGNAPPPTTDGPQSLLGAIALALAVGVIFNLVPCVLPVLPLKAIGFYEASHHDRAKTILLGLLFSAGMIAIFALLACVVLLSRSLLGQQFQWGQQFSYGWFVWTMAAILGLLGFSMMGAFTVSLPTSIYGLNFRHDTLVGNFMWGGLTAVLSTPCTAPLFPPLLAWAIAQPLVSGFVTIIAVGVGMALPYLVLSAFPELARKFPRTGPFAELFKQMMGFLLLGSAAFFVGIRLIGDPNQWWLVYAVVVIASVYLVYRTRQIVPSARAMGIATTIAVLMTVGGFGGARYLAKPSVGFEPYTPQALVTARAGKDVVLVKFTASWCLNCKYIEQTVYHNDATLAELQKRGVRMIKVDLTDAAATGWELADQLGVKGIPFTAIFPVGAEKPLTLESIYTADTLLATLDKVKASPAVAAMR